MGIMNEGMSAADLAAIVGNNGDGFGNGNGAWWLLILLIFANNGWGNNWGGNGGAFMGYATQQDVQSGFDQAALMAGINGINSVVSNGFANAEVSRANTLTNLTNQINTIAMNQQNNCYENRLATANLGAALAQEACADRQAVNDGVRDLMAINTANTQALMNTINGGIQSITDKLCQQEIDTLKAQNANLQTQLNMQNLAASQATQTAQLIQDNNAQTATLINRIAPYPVPSYQVANPFANTGYFYSTPGCGCGNM